MSRFVAIALCFLALSAGTGAARGAGKGPGFGFAAGGAGILNDETLPDHDLDVAIAWRATGSMFLGPRVSLDLAVSRSEFVSDGGGIFLSYTGTPYELGAAEKSVWLVMPKLRINVVSILEDRLQLDIRGGVGFEQSVLTEHGDLNLDTGAEGRTTTRTLNNGLPLIGAGLSIAAGERTWVALDYEVTFASQDKYYPGDTTGYLMLGLGFRLE